MSTRAAKIIVCVDVCVSQRGEEEGRRKRRVGGLPCRLALLTMLGCGTAQVCRIRVCEMLAESISWAAQRWKDPIRRGNRKRKKEAFISITA